MRSETKKLLAQARALGLSDHDICRLADVTYTTLWRWERSKYTPSLSKFVRLQKALDKHATANAHRA
jgi:transcriptional regulator with XRE-family HTH domain